MLMDAITTLPPAGAETTVAPSIAAGVTQQTVTMTSTDVTDVQSTLPPATGSGIVVQNMTSTQSANSLTTVTSGESVQPTPSVGAETVAGSQNTITPMTDSQTIPTTTLAEGNQGPSRTFPAVATGDSSGTSTSVPDESTQVSTDASMATAAATIMSMSQVPSTFATEVLTTINTPSPDSSAMIAAGASTDALEAASTVVADVTPADTPSATLSTVTMNSLTTVIPAILNSANATIPSPVTETTMVNGLISRTANTETSADTPEMTAANELAMTTDTDGAVNPGSTVVSPVPGTDATSGDLAENNTTIANSTMSPVDNQMAASLIDENTISSRKRKDLTDIVNSNTVKDESTDGSPNLRKRSARSPRGYFSSYPGQIQLTNIFFQ